MSSNNPEYDGPENEESAETVDDVSNVEEPSTETSGELMDGSLQDDEVRIDDSFFGSATGEVEDITEESKPLGGLADIGLGEDVPAGPVKKGPNLLAGLGKKNKKASSDSVETVESSADAPVKKPKFKLPIGRKKKAEGDVVADSGFALGSAPDSTDTSDPFSKSFQISDTDEDGIKILSDKERKKRSKKKNPLTLGQKYGGQRKWFAVLGALLVVSVLFNVLNFMLLQGKANTDNVQGLVEQEVENSTASSFPVGQAGMWMESFVRIYGTWDYKTPAGRASDLSPYLAPGMDSQAGWDGTGTQKVIYSAVSTSPEIVDKNRAIFDVTYQIQDGTWRCAQIPVFAFKPGSQAEGPVDQWGFAVTTNPVPMPCALRVSVPDFEENRFENTDNAAAQTLAANFFPGFFTAWVTSDADTLKQYMGPNIKTFGLGGAYEGNPQVTDVTLPIGVEEEAAASNTVYSAYVKVILTDAQGAKLTVTYKVPVALTGGTQWQVMGEPEPVIQGTEVGGSGDLPSNEGNDPEKEAENGEENEYEEPQEPGNEQPDESQPTVPPADEEE